MHEPPGEMTLTTSPLPDDCDAVTVRQVTVIVSRAADDQLPTTVTGPGEVVNEALRLGVNGARRPAIVREVVVVAALAVVATGRGVVVVGLVVERASFVVRVDVVVEVELEVDVEVDVVAATAL